MEGNDTAHPILRLVLGLGAGALTLIGMIRLVAGNFDGRLAVFAWVVVALAMIPWIGYCAWRSWHGRLNLKRALVVAILVVVGLVVVWLFVLGPVIGLACSLAAFVLIWISDWPGKRATGEEKFVAFEELAESTEDDPDPDEPSRNDPPRNDPPRQHDPPRDDADPDAPTRQRSTAPGRITGALDQPST
ncbi:hypothetical protein [Microlunatus speluncae]|uniref:hypothetical protein n=1 Tax=Microlunatus speluncae TaxID=2594267 RepID=UPI0012668137|nr:hypothetical protein [Microlunatus speluncae]